MTTFLTISIIPLWIGFAVLTVLVVGLIRQTSGVAPTPAAPDGRIAPGSPAPSFEVTGHRGSVVSNGSLEGQTYAVLFVSPDCPTCVASLAEIEALSSGGDRSVLVVCRSISSRCDQIMGEMVTGDYDFVTDPTDSIAQLFGITVNPTAVLVDENGVVMKYGHPLRQEDMFEMVETV